MSHVSVVQATVPDDLLPEHEQAPGGPVLSDEQVPQREVTEDDVQALDPESPAARLRARMAKVGNRQERFPMPPLDVWEGDLVMVAKPIELKRGNTLVSVVSQMTVDMLWRDNDGDLKSIAEVEAPGLGRKARAGWLGIGEVAGFITPENASRVSVGDIIMAVCGAGEDANPVIAEQVLGVFVQDLVAWIAGRRSEVAAALGE